MERTWYGFNFDFVRHRGICLVLSGVQPIRYDDLERIGRRMLESNDIPGLLPLEIEEIDLQIRFRYDITGYKMLSHWMKSEKLALQTYYRLLLQCAKIIDDSKIYMLREEGYWLHEDFLFVRPESPDELKIVYVPVAAADAGPAGAKPPVREQFKELALRLSGCIDRIEGSEFSALMSVLRRERFEFHELKKQLSSYLDPVQTARGAKLQLSPIDPEPGPTATPDHPDRRASAMGGSPPNAGKTEARASGAIAGRADGLSEPDAEPLNIPSWIGVRADSAANDRGGSSHTFPIWSGLEGIEEELEKSDPAIRSAEGAVEGKPLAPRQRLLAGAGAGAVLLLLWSFYPAEAPEGALIVWAGLTVLLLDAIFVFVLLRSGWPGKGKLHAIAQSYQAMEEREMTGLTGYMPPRKKEERQQPRSSTSAVSASAASSSGHLSPEHNEPFSGLYGRQEAATAAEPTTLLRAPDATVLLRPEGSGLQERIEPEQQQYDELEVHKAGTVQRVPLKSERFVIGRDAGAADFTEDTAGVSKLHAEIVCERASYYAKDLGSKNGTLWNNEPMVPYKWYPLAEGDSLQIVHTRFVFVGKSVGT